MIWQVDLGILRIPISKNVNDEVSVVSTIPTKEGYEFVGWTYSEDSGKDYKAGDTFTMPAKNVTLTAKWSPAVTALKVEANSDEKLIMVKNSQ